MATQPNATLYINNLNDKVNKEELKIQLFALFTTYGKLVDIVASKSQKMRGQAFLVFSDLAGATSALRACDGMIFYEKPMVRYQDYARANVSDAMQHIAYAKTKSYATLRREDPNFVQPTVANAGNALVNGKRPRDGDADDRRAKREKSDDSDEEMEIDEDEEPTDKVNPCTSHRCIPHVHDLRRYFSKHPSPLCRRKLNNHRRAYCALIYPMKSRMMSFLCFSNSALLASLSLPHLTICRYKGFQKTHVQWSPQLNPQGIRVKMSQVFFETPDLAAVAKEALDGFTLKKGWKMSVVFV